jgi:general secretion pathway protein D
VTGRPRRATGAALALLLAAGLATPRASALGDLPADESQQPADTAQPDTQPPPPAAQPLSATRRVMDGPPTALAFKSVTVDQIIPFIVEATGKVVLPQQDILSRKITVLNDQPIPREQALDLVFLALQQNGIAVVEKDLTITLRDIAEVVRQDVPVIPPEVSVLARSDLGTIVEKVYTLRHVTAKKFGDTIKGSLPEYAKLTLDEESNQIAVMGSISLQKRIETLVKSLDRAAAATIVTETFRLRFADAEQVAANINELFGDSTQSTTGARARRTQNQSQPQFNPFGRQQGQQEAASTTELRVTTSTQQNAVTVAADPVIISQIRHQIENFWDKPLPDEAVIPKIYELKNSDPVKVRDLLEGMFGRGTPAGQPGQGQQGQQGQQGGANRSASSSGTGRLAGQFSFQAIPESNRLVVLSKSPDNIAVIDKIIEGIDQPLATGLPTIIELKHASAEDLAEQLNALLAQDGTGYALRRSASGLSASSSSTSPFAGTAASNTSTATQNPDGTTSSSDSINFWWQRARQQTDQRTASNLVGKLRIVPVWRQNAVMIVAPPEYRASIADLVSQLDRPGRQVLLSALIAEISTDDALSLGLRWSSTQITPSNGDNSISLTNGFQGTSNNNFAGNLFDTTVLNSNVNLNLLLQALAQKTNVSILSEPRIFTSDNQEAEFFNGQDVPFITESQPNTQGNLVQSFDYKAVGIALRIRPRITVRRDVDLRVNVELSSFVPGNTLFGGVIIDRRETSTQIIVKDKQTIVISGILRSEDTNVVRKIPLLGDIPLLGELFKSREKTKKNSELLVFITPIVVENPEEADEVNSPYRQRLEERKNALDASDPMRTRSATSQDTKPAPDAQPSLEPTPAEQPK